MAVGVALSPVPILAIVLLVGTPHERANGLAFAVGWVVGLAIVGAIALLAHGTSRTSGNRVTSGIELAVGLFFVLLAWRIWRRRPERGEAPELPRWMRTIDSFTTLRSLGAGVALSALNPKTLTLTIAAAAAIGDAGLSAGREAGVLATFVLRGSLSILVPLALYLRLGELAKDLLERLRARVAQHGPAVGTAVLLVLAAKLIGAIVGFSS